MVSRPVLDETQQISLCEILDRVLNKRVVVAAEATISVADVDPLYLGLQVILTSMETGRRHANSVVDGARGTGIGEGVGDGMV
jgi:hypothetical protein